MTEATSTLDLPLKWAAKEGRKDDALQTGFFLFQGDEGRVVVRGPSEKHGTIPDSRSVTATFSGSESGVRSSSPARATHVPETRVLRGQLNQRYIQLKKYEGFVTARDENSFWARLFENDSDYPVIEAEFDLEELSETDRKLVVEGAPLVWTIGYGYEGSTRKRESLIYLRRLPAWNDKELEKGRAAADELTRGIEWE